MLCRWQKINWLCWFVLVILWNCFSKCNSTSRCISCRNFVDIIYNYSEAQSRDLQNRGSRSKFKINEGTFDMGIHYDYKSTRGDKAMKKEANEKPE